MHLEIGHHLAEGGAARVALANRSANLQIDMYIAPLLREAVKAEEMQIA
jgi:hypothetical protein